MPAKNALKDYVENGYYHIYNRGISKQPIFIDKQDYGVFLRYLSDYLLPKNEFDMISIIGNPATSLTDKDKARKLLRLSNYFGKINLIAYSLMPNHFHLLIKQSESTAIDSFMSSFSIRYSMYFNLKYKRLGPLYQAVYKAVLVTSDEQLIYLSKYIHRQATDFTPPCPSSLDYYLNNSKSDFLHTEEILGFFAKANLAKSYFDFVFDKEPIDAPFLTDLCFID